MISKNFYLIFQKYPSETTINVINEGIPLHIATYDYEKFVHIMDTEGNKIKLWEPIEAD